MQIFFITLDNKVTTDHIRDETPHVFFYGDVKYKYGFGVTDVGGLQFKYEKVIKEAE